jgi:hypothetical protein
LKIRRHDSLGPRNTRTTQNQEDGFSSA